MADLQRGPFSFPMKLQTILNRTQAGIQAELHVLRDFPLGYRAVTIWTFDRDKCKELAPPSPTPLDCSRRRVRAFFIPKRINPQSNILKQVAAR